MIYPKMVAPTSFALLFNSLMLSIASVVYCILWFKNNMQCGQAEMLITVLTGINASIYGISFLVDLISVCSFLMAKGSLHRLSAVNLTLSILCFGVALVSGVGMLISLSFQFDTTCLKEKANLVDFSFLWFIVIYSVVTNFILALFSLILTSRIQDSQDLKTQQVQPASIQPQMVKNTNEDKTQIV